MLEIVVDRTDVEHVAVLKEKFGGPLPAQDRLLRLRGRGAFRLPPVPGTTHGMRPPASQLDPSLPLLAASPSASGLQAPFSRRLGQVLPGLLLDPDEAVGRVREELGASRAPDILVRTARWPTSRNS